MHSSCICSNFYFLAFQYSRTIIACSYVQKPSKNMADKQHKFKSLEKSHHTKLPQFVYKTFTKYMI